MLSRLLGDPVYESYARRAINALWKHRNTTTDLFSNDINIETGLWVSKVIIFKYFKLYGESFCFKSVPYLITKINCPH